MALGLLLWVSCSCFLLFQGSAGSPAIKGYGYPYRADTRNIGDDGEDEVFIAPTFDQSNWQASNNQPTGPVYASYNEPTVVQSPDWEPSQQNLHETPSREIERLVNGVSRDWELENPDKPLVFPLLSEPAKPQPGPVWPQSTFSVPSTNGMSASSSKGSTHVGSTTYHASSATTEAAKSPSFDSWQPEPDRSGYGVAGSSSDYSAAGGNIPHLVYEHVFRYPSENTEPSMRYGTSFNTAGEYGQANYESRESSTGYAPSLGEPSFPSYPTNTQADPIYPSRMGNVPESANYFGQTSYQPQEPVSTQRMRGPVYPPAPLSRIIQSRNGYERFSQSISESSYEPEFQSAMPVSLKGVEGPAPGKPAAPKGVKKT